jgi:ABC-type Zn uptake system ZnuABC Zn-binding protein ZnuA
MVRRLVLVLLAACQSASAQQPGERLRVVAIYNVLGDLVQPALGVGVARGR